MWRYAFCCLAILAVSSTPSPQSALDALPSSVRERATLVISAKLTRGRSVCIPRGKGMRAWAIETSLEVHDVLRGTVAARHLQINEAMLPKSKYVPTTKLTEGETYLLLLRPSAESMKIIGDHEGMFNYSTAMRDDEIVAIVGPIGK
jgi:hypothetical protein